MDKLTGWALGLAAGLALIAVVYAIVTAITAARRRRQRQRDKASEWQKRWWRRQQLLSTLKSLDLAVSKLAAAATQGNAELERESHIRRAQAISAATRSGDDELRRLVETLITHCEALKAGYGYKYGDENGSEDERRRRIIQQLGEDQQEIYRRMKVLLDHTLD